MTITVFVGLAEFVDKWLQSKLTFVLLKCVSMVPCNFKSKNSTNVREMNTSKSFYHLSSYLNRCHKIILGETVALRHTIGDFILRSTRRVNCFCCRFGSKYREPNFISRKRLESIFWMICADPKKKINAGSKIMSISFIAHCLLFSSLES